MTFDIKTIIWRMLDTIPPIHPLVSLLALATAQLLLVSLDASWKQELIFWSGVLVGGGTIWWLLRER